MQPTHVDGCSVVVLRQDDWAFHIVERGILEFDGEILWLVDGLERREFATHELDGAMGVTPQNRLPGCQGFDLFLLV